jgi:hypothetical protein
MNFKQWYENTEDFTKTCDAYINPDYLLWALGRNSKTFIYDGSLYMASDISVRGGGSLADESIHFDMLMFSSELRNKIDPNFDWTDYGRTLQTIDIVKTPEGKKVLNYRNNLMKTPEGKKVLNYRHKKGMNEMLFGRLLNVSSRTFKNLFCSQHGFRSKEDLSSDVWQGKGSLKIPEYTKNVCVISFWNNNAALYNRLLSGCIEALRSRNKINGEVFISTPQTGIRHISNLNKISSDLNKNEKDLHDLRMRLHAATGTERSLIKSKINDLSGSDSSVGKTGFGSNRSIDRAKLRDAMSDAGMSGYLTQSENKLL